MLPRKEEKTCSCVLQHNLPPTHNGGPSWEHIFDLQKHDVRRIMFHAINFTSSQTSIMPTKMSSNVPALKKRTDFGTRGRWQEN